VLEARAFFLGRRYATCKRNMRWLILTARIFIISGARFLIQNSVLHGTKHYWQIFVKTARCWHLFITQLMLVKHGGKVQRGSRIRADIIIREVFSFVHLATFWQLTILGRLYFKCSSTYGKSGRKITIC